MKSKYKILYGKRINAIERAKECPMELMLDEMAKKDMSYRQMAQYLGQGISSAHIQQWLKRMDFGKAKRGARSKPTLSAEDLKAKFELSF